MTDSESSKTKIVIIGGGFAGLFSARRLYKELGDSVSIELISEINYFVFQPLLPEVAAGTINAQDAVSPLRTLLPNIKVRLATVQSINSDQKTIQLLQGRKRKLQTLAYDELIVSTGQATDLSMFPGFSQHSLTMKTLADAHHLRNHVIQCMEMADITSYPEIKEQALTFVVAGGGFSGVETMGELLEMIHRVRPRYPNIKAEDIRTVLIQRGGRLLPEMSEKLSAYTLKKLAQRGTDVWLKTSIKSASRYSLLTVDGRSIATHTIITTIGNGPSEFVKKLPIELARGKIPVNTDLSVKGIEHMWALGDVALIPLGNDEPPSYAPPTAQFASREAKMLALNLKAKLHGQDTHAFSYQANGSLASLGGYSGVAEIYGVSITGFPAWFLWRFIYIGLLPSFSARLRVALNWVFDYFMPRTIVSMDQQESHATQYLRFMKGELVHDEQEVLEGLYIVRSGQFEQSLTTGDGLIHTKVFSAGDTWGERCLSEDRLSKGRVIALEDSELLLVKAADFMRFRSNYAPLDQALMNEE